MFYKQNNISKYIYILLYPLLYLFSQLFYIALSIRHFLYDKKILPSYHFSEIYTICIGNLSLGGTGKTPLTNYLINLLKSKYKIAVLSRGYGRKIKGFRVITLEDNFMQTGDEPLMYKLKHPDVIVAVCENRVEGIQKLLNIYPDIQVILLDDAFQHRRIKADLNILVSEYQNLFFKDKLFPLGKLRDIQSRSKNADILVVSKTPENTTKEQLIQTTSQIQKYFDKDIFYSSIEYEEFYHITENKKINPIQHLSLYNCILVTGIANPLPLAQFVEEYANHFYHLSYPDHHHFTDKDFDLIISVYKEWQKHHPPAIIVTTEKDAMRLKSFISPQFNLPIFVAPIQIHFFQQQLFDNKILNYVRTNSTNC